MKTRPRDTFILTKFEGVRLYREDFEEIVSIIRGHGLHAGIYDGTFEYENVDQIIEKRGLSPNALTIEAKKPGDDHVMEKLTIRYYGKLWLLDSDGTDVLPATREIEALLSQRKSGITQLPVLVFFAAGSILMFMASFPLPVAAKIAFRSVGGTLIALALTPTLHYFLVPGIFLRYRHNASFWSRNHDQVKLLFVGSVIGALATFVLQWILR